MTESNKKLKNRVKHKVGLALSETRHKLGLKLKDLAKETGLSWQDIDNVETGHICGWPTYRRLLEFYGKEIKIELVDKTAE